MDSTEIVPISNSRIVPNTICQALQGEVQFDLGEISHSSFGTVHIQGKIPRIRPRFQRLSLTSDELEYMQANLRSWVNKYFDESQLDGRFFSGMVDCLSAFVPFTYPLAGIQTQKMDIALKLIYWAWILDNILEIVVEEKTVSKEVLQRGLNQLLDLLENGKGIYQEVPNLLVLRSLYISMQGLMAEFEKFDASYLNVWSLFHFAMERYFIAMLLTYSSPVDASWSEESFRSWRNILTYFEVCQIGAWILEHGNMPPKIWNSASIRRILDSLNSICGLTGDLLGMKKDFLKNEGDNLVVFKVLHKNIPIMDAVDQVAGLIQEELEDYLVLRNAFLEEFNKDPVLLKFIDMIESVIDGNNQFFARSARHLSAGLVHLID